MGGPVSVFIREENGQDHRLTSWTNDLPFFAVNMDFIDKNPDHTQKFIQFQEPGSLAPKGYGIVVFDLQRNLILSYQSYTNLEVIHESPSVFKTAISEDFYISNKDPDWEESRICALYRAGRFKYKEDSSHYYIFKVDMSPFTIERFKDPYSIYKRISEFYQLTEEDEKIWVQWFEKTEKGD